MSSGEFRRPVFGQLALYYFDEERVQHLLTIAIRNRLDVVEGRLRP